MPLTHAVPAHLLLNRWTLLCDRIDWLYAPSPRQTAPQANKCLLSFRVAHYCLLCTVRRGALTYTDNSNFIQKNDTRKLLVTTNTTILLQHPRRTKKNMYTHAHTHTHTNIYTHTHIHTHTHEQKIRTFFCVSKSVIFLLQLNFNE